MYQIIKSSLKDPKDKTQLSLIYANVNEDDICEFCLAFELQGLAPFCLWVLQLTPSSFQVLRQELEVLQDRSKGRFKLFVSFNLQVLST